MRARRGWALPLVPVYAAVVAAKERLRASGVLATKRLAWPVVSVGSLSAGGAGKTPVVIALAGMLRERGWRVDVLSRGYGRRRPGVLQVDAAEAGASEHYGDEPVLIAERTGVDVWVGRDRYAAGLAAEAAHSSREEMRDEWGTQGVGKDQGVHLLDDGFQHRRLARAVDIVLVTAEDLGEALLPAGNRREPLAALKRAHIAVVREEEAEALVPRLRPLLRGDALIWTLRRKLRFPAPLFVFGAGMRPVAFCAIARPEGFAALLQAAGCGIADTIFFPDHHRYSERDVDRIVELATELKATGLVTTEKDAVKLNAAMRARLEAVGPVMVAALDAEFLFPERVARELEARLLAAEAAR